MRYSFYGGIFMNQPKRSKKRKPNYFRITCVFFVFLLLLFAVGHKIGDDKSITDSHSSTSSTVEEKQDITIHLSAIGDAMCHSQNFKDAYDEASKTYDFSHVFTDIKEHLNTADFAIGNLETTFAGEERGYSGYPTFNTPSAFGVALKDIGIDVLTTANNHSIDKGYSGIVSTLDALDEIGIAHTGTARSEEEQNKVLVQDIHGIKFAFLTFTYGTNGISIPKGKEYCVNLIDKELIKKQIEQAKAENVDVICVSMHWGDEYKLKQNATQEELADFLFENGVDIILGSHPHVLEPMEKRTITLEDGTTKDGFVIYSLGNFVSGQVKENTKNTIILDMQITKNKEGKISIDKVDYTPLYMYDKGAGKSKRYKLLDIRKTLSNYENGTDTSIGSSMYQTLKTELTKIENIMGEPIS